MECRGLVAEVDHPELGTLRIRTPTPYDKPRIERFLERLSEESVFHRFFRRLRSTREIVEKMLSEEILLYIVIERGDDVVACGELYRTTWPDVVEPAVTVLDEYQGKGLGKLLVAIMTYCALKAGVSRFRAYVLPDNTSVIKIVSRLHPRLVKDYGDVHLYEMRIDLAWKEVERVLKSWGLRDP